MSNMLLMLVLQLPPSPTSLADAVVAAVRGGVQSGELVPNTTYSVYQLAEVLGVSRSPVREALLKLSEAGLVEISRNRGFRVLLPTAHDIAEIFEIRAALEPPAARRVAEHGRPEDLARLSILLADLGLAADDGDERAFWAVDHALHDAILRGAGNGRSATIVELAPLSHRTARPAHHGHRTHAPGDLRRACADHRRHRGARRRRTPS